MEEHKNKIFRLEGKIQHYEWGGNSWLPEVLHLENPEKKPFAEYWLGTHDRGTAEMILPNDSRIKLNEYIREYPKQTLGAQIASEFGRLPYLLKILDVKDMLSIQVHPSKKSAAFEFAEENKKGIPLHAANRNYKDDNHKPELALALGEFWLLHGFKPKDQLLGTLKNCDALNFLLPVFENAGYEGIYREVMEMDQIKVNELLMPLLQSIVPAYKKNKIRKDHPDFWAARASETHHHPKNIDRGIFSIYFFNLVQLPQGQAIFQDAGLPHAYLEGHNIEIMANSDNVLRGGLSSKHIDLKELMKHIHFKETHPTFIAASPLPSYVSAFKTRVNDFELRKITLKKNETLILRSGTAEIFLIMEGEIEVRENGQKSFIRRKGESFVSFAESDFTVRGMEDATIYFAGIPGV